MKPMSWPSALTLPPLKYNAEAAVNSSSLCVAPVQPPPALCCAAISWTYLSKLLPPPQCPLASSTPTSFAHPRRLHSLQSRAVDANGGRTRRFQAGSQAAKAEPWPAIARLAPPYGHHRRLMPDFKARRRLRFPVRSTTLATPQKLWFGLKS
jgi:hypothetical protein